jgi:hypothetical protein
MVTADGRHRLSTGDYHGQPTRRLENDHVWVEVLANAGPRIIGVGLSGAPENVLAETPDVGWQTPLGRYELFGGHRLWFAPEDPNLVAVPDSNGLTISVTDGGIGLDGPPDPVTGLVRSIAIELDPLRSAVALHHRLTNSGSRLLELAPWSITQLPLGGLVRLPQPQATNEHAVHPNRLLVLWPYTSWEDGRLRLGDGECLVRGDPGPSMKIGSFIDRGTVTYSRAGIEFTSRFEPQPGARYPDMGCNVEVYVGASFLELEILGPLVEIEPGSVAVLDERWELARVAES